MKFGEINRNLRHRTSSGISEVSASEFTRNMYSVLVVSSDQLKPIVLCTLSQLSSDFEGLSLH